MIEGMYSTMGRIGSGTIPVAVLAFALIRQSFVNKFTMSREGPRGEIKTPRTN